MHATITDIQRFSIHDGPGIRTLVFFKGCPLRCAWCQNPEAIDPAPVLDFRIEKCIGCGKCKESCPRGAITIKRAKVQVRRDLCIAARGCHACVDACKTGTFHITGTRFTVNLLIGEVMKDKPYYDTSGGGVTASGGEPMMQWAFVREFFMACKTRGVSTAIETCGFYDPSVNDELLEICDTILIDVKHLDDEIHRKITGRGNGTILENIERLVEATRRRDTRSSLVVRMPVIRGINNDHAHLARVDTHLAMLGVEQLVLLPYHEMWKQKVSRYGLERHPFHAMVHSQEELEAIRQQFIKTRILVG